MGFLLRRQGAGHVRVCFQSADDLLVDQFLDAEAAKQLVINGAPGADFLPGGGLDDGVDPDVGQEDYGLRQRPGMGGVDGAVGDALTDDGFNKKRNDIFVDIAQLHGQKFGVVLEIGHHVEGFGLTLQLQRAPGDGPELLQAGQGAVVPELRQSFAVPPADAFADGVEYIFLGGEVVVNGPLG